MIPRDKVDKKHLFDLDSDVSDDDPEEVSQLKQNIYQSEEQKLYEQNLHKYVSYLNEFSDKAQQAEKLTYCDGVTYVNHPLIDITQINYEKNIGFFDILDVENQDNKNNFIKTMTVFTFLDNEVNKIIQILQTSHYDSLLMYGQEIDQQKSNQSCEIMTARVLPLYKKIFSLVRKLISYIQNLIIQLHSMINKKQTLYKTHFKGLNLDFALNIIGRALRAIYVIDCIVMNNPLIEEHWQQYKKMIKLARKQPQKYNTTNLKLKKLEKLMGKFEGTILSKKCMETVMQIGFDKTIELKKLPVSNIRSNKQLKEYIEQYLQKTLKNIEESLGSVVSSSDEEKRLLDVLCIFGFYKRLYPSEEFKDFWKKAWSFQKQIPIVSAHSFVCVYISFFMSSICPISKKPTTMDPKDPNSFIKEYIEKLDIRIGVNLVNDYTSFCVWLSRMESFITSNSSLKQFKKESMKQIQQRFSNRIFLLCEGINIIYRLNKLIYLCIILHINEQKPINKKLLGNLILGMQSLKATAYIIKKKADSFDTSVLTKIIARDMMIILQPIKAHLQTECRESTKKREQYFERKQAVSLIVRLLKTPLSELKIAIIKYSLCFLDNKSVLKKDQHNHLMNLLHKLQVVAYHQILVQKYQSFDYLYYCKDILPVIFEWKRENPNTCKRLQFMFDSFQDSAYLLKKCRHLTNNNQLFENYRKFVLIKFQEHYMLPLKRKVEDFLRISIHCMLIEKLDGMNPYREEMSDLVKLVQFQKIRIFDTIVDLQVQITKSFNETFYNMNTINIYDMETYEQMRIMANYLFGLHLHDVYLPNQTITQGNFDILSIIRNIPEFIVSYKYNLLSQKFLQVTTQSKMVSTIGIEQLSDSIRTHGMGILSTTVNSFYRFLAKKMQGFNKFLHNDSIKSLLLRQRKWYKQEQERDKDYECNYPFERAKKLYSQIKKLGKFEDETNYLDQFRQILTSIGNSLGFIRLIRSASLNYSSKSIQFHPTKIQLSESLQEIAAKAYLSQTAKYSCKELDQLLKAIEDHFSDKIDYLNLMIKLFSKMVTRENDHLQNFYMLIPALSINYVQEIVRGKEQITKKFSSKAYIYDDGLVLGIAYCLCLLRQNLQFKTLQWSSASNSYFQSAKTYSKDVSDMGSHSAKFREDMNIQNQLLFKKLELMEQQFNFFNCNLISSNVLFKNQAPSVKDAVSPPSAQNAQN